MAWLHRRWSRLQLSHLLLWQVDSMTLRHAMGYKGMCLCLGFRLPSEQGWECLVNGNMSKERAKVQQEV